MENNLNLYYITNYGVCQEFVQKMSKSVDKREIG